MPVKMTSGKEIRQGLVEYGDWLFIGRQVLAVGATTTAIPDATRLRGLSLPSTLFNNSVVRITSGAQAGERTYVDYLDPNSGILYVNPALSAALKDTDEYEIWMRGIDPDIVDRLRDDCLQKFCSQWRVVSFAQLPDGDMEDAPDTNLVAIASSTNATPIAVTTSTAHGLVTGASVNIEGHLVNLSANGKWIITVTGTSVFTLDGSTPTGVGTTSGNVACRNGVPRWTATGSSILNKISGNFPNTHSRQVLHVVGPASANDYATSQAIPVQPNDLWFLEVPCSAFLTAAPASLAIGTVTVIDVTNASGTIALTGVTTHTGRGVGIISVLFEIPSGCYEILVRLGSSTNLATTVWGGISMHERDQYRFSLQDRVTSRKRVGGFYTLQRETESGTSDERYKNAPFQSIERVQVGGQVEIYINPSTSEFPMFYYERGYYERMNPNYFTTNNRLSGDLAMTDAQKEYIISATAARVAKYYLDKVGGEWQDDWIRASADFNYWEGQHGPEPKLIAEVESELYVPQIAT